jgi:predicted restriction endonuclease
MRSPRQPKWTREQILKAMCLYQLLPFGQFDEGNPDVRALAAEINRSPGAVAMKLSNLASLDPDHEIRGVKGLVNASTLDRQVWKEYEGHWDELAEAMPVALKKAEEEPPELAPPIGPTVQLRLTRIRRNHPFFSRAVVSAYGERCCITGIAIRRLLRASHILPWSTNERQRLNPRNGLCLNALHDAAFDSGLLTIDDNLRVEFSPRVAESMTVEAYAAHFGQYEGSRITPPKWFQPDPEFLREHRGQHLGS